MDSRATVVVLGMMGRTPFAGVGWQVLHYLEAFRRLGHDVWYVEDTGDWPYDPEENAITGDSGYTLRYIDGMTAWCGMAGRWAYRSAAEDGRVFGLSAARLEGLFARADVLVNLRGATILREEHLQVPVRVYLETDPVLPQIEVARGRRFTVDLMAAHTHHYTYGENLGGPDCGVPLDGCVDYRPTRPPVVLDWWEPARIAPPPAPNPCFTTVASWQQTGKDVEWSGESYRWSKHHEYLKIIDLPRRTDQPLEIALAGDPEAVRLLERNGWRVVDALAISQHHLPYRSYVVGSRGELSVAKDQNIRLRSGWFSDRSACYLAAGKPVVTQDTAFGNVLPTGRGLFAFRTDEEIASAFQAIEADYGGHCAAAREIAWEYFSAERVVGELLDGVTSTSPS